MLKLFARLAALIGVGSSAICAAAEDMTQQSTIATNSPSTMRRVVITNPRIVVHREFALEWPLICFTVSNRSKIAISRLIMDGSLRIRGRAVPLIDHRIDYAIPGGLEPGETKSFGLDADVIGGWNGITPWAVRRANLHLKLTAIDDARGMEFRDEPSPHAPADDRRSDEETGGAEKDKSQESVWHSLLLIPGEFPSSMEKIEAQAPKST
jgi:hypothetical protein